MSKTSDPYANAGADAGADLRTHNTTQSQSQSQAHNTTHVHVPKLSNAAIDHINQTLCFKRNEVTFRITPGIDRFICLRFEKHTKGALLATQVRVLFLDSETTNYRHFGEQLALMLHQFWVSSDCKNADMWLLQHEIFDEAVEHLREKFDYTFVKTRRGLRNRTLNVLTTTRAASHHLESKSW